jgi:hypothetical protein
LTPLLPACLALLPAGPPGMGFFFTWLRLSTLRQLDW